MTLMIPIFEKMLAKGIVPQRPTKGILNFFGSALTGPQYSGQNSNWTKFENAEIKCLGNTSFKSII